MMKNKILYFFLVIVLVYCFFQKIKHRQEIEALKPEIRKSFLYDKIKQSIQIEEEIKIKNMNNFRLIEPNQANTLLYDVFSKIQQPFCVLVFISFDSCSLCRDQTLETWNRLYNENKSMPIFLVITEERHLQFNDVKKVKAYLRGRDIDLPFYLDAEAAFFRDFLIKPDQTPLSIIFRFDRKIIAVNKAAEEILDRTERFRDLFQVLISKEE